MANRFWVGGTGNTSSTSHWSATTGGSTGASVPVAGDIVAFDTNSGTGTVTDDAGLTCASITHSKAGLTVSASAAQTVTGAVTVSAGSWITGAFTHSYGSFVSNAGTRTVNCSGSTINITQTANASNTWVLSSAGLTFTAPAVLNFTVGSINSNFVPNMAGLAYAAVSITAAGLWVIGAFSATSFTYTSTADKRNSFSLSGDISLGAGTLSLSGNSVLNRALVKSSVFGTQHIITVNAGATVSITNCNFQDINMAGTFSTGATASSIGDCLGNTFGWSSVQPDPSVSLTLGSTGTINWSTATWTGTTNRVPLPQDDVNLGSSSTATTLTADMPFLGRNIDASGYLKTLSFASTPNTLFGNVTLPVGAATLSGTQALTLAGRGAQTITSNGKTFSQSVTIAAFGGAYTAQDDLNFPTTAGMTIINGTLALGAMNFTGQFIGASGTATKGISSSGTFSLTSATGIPWNMPFPTTGLSLSLSGSTIKYMGNTSTTVTFAGQGLIYGTLNWFSTGSTGILAITGANTFADIQTDPSTARTIQLPASTTTTVSAFSAQGSATNLLSLTSSTPGTKATLSKPSGVVSSDYLSINDSAATGGAGWYAGTHSTDNGTNTGWVFNSFLAVSGGGQMLLRGVGG